MLKSDINERYIDLANIIYVKKQRLGTYKARLANTNNRYLKFNMEKMIERLEAEIADYETELELLSHEAV